MVSVAEGTGAIRAYEAMVYGMERNEPGDTREVEAVAAPGPQAGFPFDVYGFGSTGGTSKLMVDS